jgi:CRISPR/Cas system-associated exonuclease Cas4 (RecB family)
MNEFLFNNGHVELTTLPKKFKKLTATRFATIMGLNAWSTPFAAWCEMTRTYEDPFEDTVYTIAGKVIEPKICDYLKDRYFMDIKSPTDVYGPDYFKKTWGDFFPDTEALGGMWDFLGDDFVVEVKTTKRVEDWRGVDGKVEPPIYYKLQACLYAYLLGFDDVVMTCSFLEDKDYANPEAFIPDMDNTVVIEFSLSEEFPTFKESYIEPALRFWREHVLTGISPEFDEKKDAEILKVLRKNTVEPDDKDITKLIAEADKLQVAIDKAESKIEEKKKRLKEIDDQVKKYMTGQFREGDKKVEIPGKKYTWTLTKSERNSLDSTALKKDLPDVFGKYQKKSEVYTLKKSIIEEV